MKRGFNSLVRVIAVVFLLFPLRAFSSCQSTYNIGLSCLRIPEYFKAYHCFLLALEESRGEGNHVVEANCLLELGKISTLTSKNDSALFYLNAGMNISRKYFGAKKDLIGFYALELGKINEDQGNIEAAGDYYKLAIENLECAFGKNDIRTALAYSEFAGYYTFKRLPVQELKWSNSAFKILMSTKDINPNYSCPILIQHATATKEFYCQVPDSFPIYYPQIRSCYKRALNIARAYYNKPSYEEGKALQGLANTYTDCIRTYYLEKRLDADANWKTADSLYQEAIRVKIASLGKYNSTVGTSRYTNALIYWYHPSLNKNIEALSKFNLAFSVLDSTFKSNEDLDCPISAHTYDPYFLSILLSSKSILLGEIYAKTHQLKYLEAKYKHDKVRLIIWDYLLASFSTKDVGSVISLWNNAPFEEAIQSAFDLFQLTNNPQYALDIFDIAEKGKNNEFTQKLIQQGAITFGSNNLNTHSITLKELQNKLDQNSAFIEYVQAPTNDVKNSYGILVTKNKYTVKKIQSKIITDSLQEELQKAMQDGDVKAYELVAFELYKQLVQPLTKDADAELKSIIICPSGTYAKIPFEALTSSKNKSLKPDFRQLDYLLNHFNISYALNGGMGFSNNVIDNNKKSRGLAVFVPQFDSLPKLLFSNKQAENLQSEFLGDYYLGNTATLNTFLKNASMHSIVQVSTHSVSSLNTDYDGVLLFSNSNLKLRDLYGKKIQTDLCIISACQSGDGRSEYGDGTRSFSRAFAYSGAKGTISTLWCVDDKATADLLLEFYTQLEEGQNISNTLLEAKKEYIHTAISSEAANPFYWAGLIYTGNVNQKALLETNKVNCYLMAFAAISLITLILFWFRRSNKKTSF